MNDINELGLVRGLDVENKALSCFPSVPLIEINLGVLDVTISFLKTIVVIYVGHCHGSLFFRHGMI
jgi:hypothetical protein